MINSVIKLEDLYATKRYNKQNWDYGFFNEIQFLENFVLPQTKKLLYKKSESLSHPVFVCLFCQSTSAIV